MRIIGIDPGYDRMGVAVIEGPRERPALLFSSCLTSSAGEQFVDRLGAVSRRLRSAIEEWRPDALALEEVFFSKNQKTALRVAEVRGAVMFLAHDAGVPVFEYNPGQVKIAVAGDGRADKTQILAILPKLISIPDGRLDDEYDAIAVAITHLASARDIPTSPRGRLPTK